MLENTEKKEVNLLIDTLDDIALKNSHNKNVLKACKEALKLAYDLISDKKTNNYLLKITTHTGKMQNINSLSTYKLVCNTCLSLKDNQKTICNKCYADKTLNIYKQLAPTLIYNTLLLKYTNLSARQIPVINASFFRFEAFSDLQNDKHLKNLYKIAKYNKSCRFALWTKSIKLVLSEKTPKNVNIIISSPFLNMPLWSFNTLRDIIQQKTGAANIKLFTVYDDEHIKSITQNCAKKCALCLKCYKKNNKDIYINEKLK